MPAGSDTSGRILLLIPEKLDAKVVADALGQSDISIQLCADPAELGQVRLGRRRRLGGREEQHQRGKEDTDHRPGGRLGHPPGHALRTVAGSVFAARRAGHQAAAAAAPIRMAADTPIITGSRARPSASSVCTY